MTILLTGGRGRIARAVHTGLVAAGRPASWAAALKDISQVFQYSDPSTAAVFSEAAESASLKQVVLLSSMSSQADNENAAADPHAAAERVLLDASFATTRLQPGTFMTNAIFWAHQVRALGQIRPPYLEAEEAPIHEQDIADVALEVLLAGPGSVHDGRAYPMTGPESMTRRRQIELITQLTGVPIRPVDLSPEQAREEMAASMRNPAQLESLISYWASRVGSPHPLQSAGERRTFSTWLKDHPDVFWLGKN